MTTRTLSRLIGAATLAVLPLASRADANDRALEACTQAFIQHLASTHGTARYRVEKPATEPGVIAGYSRTRIDVALIAKLVRSGDVIARANCTATASGKLIAMKPLPVRAATRLSLSARDAR